MAKPIGVGSGEGKDTGPVPGDGDSGLGGYHDTDGTPGDALPPDPRRKERDASRPEPTDSREGTEP
jgi:hypothetical protein